MKEGGTFILTSNQLNVSDKDTFINEVYFMIVQNTLNGKLRKVSHTLIPGERFTKADVDAFRFADKFILLNLYKYNLMQYCAKHCM